MEFEKEVMLPEMPEFAEGKKVNIYVAGYKDPGEILPEVPLCQQGKELNHMLKKALKGEIYQ